jgi:hypothetical protein
VRTLTSCSRQPVSADSGDVPPAILPGRILTRLTEQSDVFLETKEMPREISMMIYDFLSSFLSFVYVCHKKSANDGALDDSCCFISNDL